MRIADRHSERLLFGFVLVCPTDRMAESRVWRVCVCMFKSHGSAYTFIHHIRLHAYTNEIHECERRNREKERKREQKSRIRHSKTK